MKRLRFLPLLLAMTLYPIAAIAQEHPEHPKKQEHPKKEAKAHDYSVDDLEKAIKADFAEKTKATDGVFKLDDPGQKTTWSLQLDKVHKDRLSKLDPETYFACVDMTDPDGRVIDVDFFLKAKDGKLRTTDMTVHKVEGKPRYNWREKEGFWERVPLKD